MEGSVAAGVASVMAAPFASVFFSMEITATFYIISNIIPALYCGLLTSFFLFSYRLLKLTEEINQTNIPSQFNGIDLFIFGMIGVICGVIGVACTSLAKYFVSCRAQKK